MTETLEPTAKVAISYSWTSGAHRKWVETLADRLLDTQIDVVLDVYTFQHGIDTIAFMERFVKDPTISKVLLVCDCAYAQKANERRGGVGIESQIISPEIYEDVEQTKFIPIVREYDDRGKPCLPIYLRSRFYVDLSSADKFEEGYADLIASIHDRTLRRKPQLGKRPSYLDDEGEPRTSTFFKARTLIDAVRNEKRGTPGFMLDYLQVLRDRLAGDDLKPFGRHISDHDAAEVVRNRVDPLLPYKSEFVEVMDEVCRYGACENVAVLDALHEFLRSLVPMMNPYDALDVSHDAGRFVVYELFLTCVAVLLANHKFDAAGYLLEQEYQLSDPRYPYDSDSLGLNNFNVFDAYVRSFDVEASQVRTMSMTHPVGQLVLKRAAPDSNRLTTEDIVNADVALHCRGLTTANRRYRWDCRTLSGRYGFPSIQLFRKAASKSFFERLRRVLNVDSAQSLRETVATLYERKELSGLAPYKSNDFDGHRKLFNLDELGTR